MSPELATFIQEMTGPKCVTTQEVEARICKRCGEPLPTELRKGTRYCSRSCQHNTTRDMEAEMLRELKGQVANIAFSHLHRDRYISFDGRREGPLNKCITFVVKLAKDKGYHPMPIDAHVPESAPKFHMVTPEDVDWGKRQGRPTQQMPRKHNAFCACCIEMVIDAQQHSVRVTKGVYLPIEHECNRVRVYNLNGVLLETKQL